MGDLIDVPVEFFNKVGVEIEGEFAMDILLEDKDENAFGEFVPESA